MLLDGDCELEGDNEMLKLGLNETDIDGLKDKLRLPLKLILLLGLTLDDGLSDTLKETEILGVEDELKDILLLGLIEALGDLETDIEMEEDGL